MRFISPNSELFNVGLRILVYEMRKRFGSFLEENLNRRLVGILGRLSCLFYTLMYNHQHDNTESKFE